MSSADREDPRPILTLLNLAVYREREALTSGLKARGHDVNAPAIRLMVELAAGPKSIAALASATSTTKQFCAREVRKLEEAGYVSVKGSADDRRALNVALRASGRRVLEAVKASKAHVDNDIARRLGKDRAETLRRLLIELIET